MMSDSKVLLSHWSSLVVPEIGLLSMLLFYLVLTLVDSLLIATVGRQIPSSTCFLMDTLNFEKISGYLATTKSLEAGN